ncbi:hypothetical protein PanWU01x14_351700 [Parasponia andersonii]|uniref:Uncharacterized protein n=1 Tax=Parasponia andersonii TaxID=3476 RepID=A0A2P5AAJ7_PARAD|nr:hypothetical protein PanWU01x14_351700 [Parasponia andersonii]
MHSSLVCKCYKHKILETCTSSAANQRTKFDTSPANPNNGSTLATRRGSVCCLGSRQLEGLEHLILL